MLYARDKSGKKPYTGVRNIEFISKQPSQFFVLTFLSLQFKFNLSSLLCLIAFPPNPFAYFLTSSLCFKIPMTRTFFNFHWRFEWEEDSRLSLKVKNPAKWGKSFEKKLISLSHFSFFASIIFPSILSSIILTFVCFILSRINDK